MVAEDKKRSDRIYAILEKMLEPKTLVTILTTAFLVSIVFILVIVTSQKQKVLQRDLANVVTSVKDLLNELTGDLTQNSSLPFFTSLYLVNKNFKEFEKRISDSDAKRNELSTKLQQQTEVQESMETFIKTAVTSINDNVAKIDRNLIDFKKQIEINQKNVSQETEKSLMLIKDELKELEKKLNMGLQRRKRTPKKMRFSLEVNGTSRLTTLNSDGAEFLVIGGPNNSIEIWGQGEFDYELKKTIYNHSAPVSALLTLRNNYIVSGSLDKSVKIYDSTGYLLKTLTGHNDTVASFALFYNNNFACGCQGGKIAIYDEQYYFYKKIDAHRGVVHSMIVLPNDDLVSAGTDGSIKMWRGDGVFKKWIVQNSHVFYHLALDREKGNFVSVSQDSVLFIWSQSGELKQSFTFAHKAGFIFCILENGDFASAAESGEIFIYNRDTGEPMRSLAGHSAPVFDLKMMYNRDLVSVSLDGTLKSWVPF